MVEEENEFTAPLLKQRPGVNEPHIVNYAQYLSDCMRRHRNSLPISERGAKAFGTNVLGEYFGDPVARNRIARAESGDFSVSWGVIAAYIMEMGAFPELLNALERGRLPTLRYIALIKNELAPEIREATEHQHKMLRHQAVQEKNR